MILNFLAPVNHLQTRGTVVEYPVKRTVERMWNVIRYEQVASTNEVRRQLAVRGADDTAVTARVQTAGKGRLGRSFQSPEGGLYLSALWRSCGSGLATMRCPLAVTITMKSACGNMGKNAEFGMLDSQFRAYYNRTSRFIFRVY